MPVSNRSAWLITAGLVILFLLLAHGWSLQAGLYLDDHSHVAQLRESDWSYQSIVDACRLGIIGRVMETWFKEETGLTFYRPVAFSLMKLQYTLVGWRPVGAHVFSLLWHFAACMLVYRLAVNGIGQRRWGAVAAVIFAAHPGHVLTVYWVACQTELMVVTFVLSGVLCYARYSNWPTPYFADRERIAAGPGIPGGHVGWLIGSLLFFVLALGCRENAVVLPVIAFVGDLLLRPGQWRRRLIPYVAFALVFVVYFVLRHRALDGFPMPTRPYMVPPNDPEFLSFIAEKFVYYMLGLFALMPMLPIGGLVYLREHPLPFTVLFAVVMVFMAFLIVVFRRRRGFLLAPLWTVLSLGPVIAVFASGHHLYLPSVGTVLMIAAFWAWALGGLLRRRPTPPSRLRGAATVVVALIHAVILPGAAWAYGWVYLTSTLVEDLVVEEVVTLTPELEDGDRLFFVNLSMMAYYIIPAIEYETGTQDLRGYVLTFSPTLLQMEEPCRVEQVDGYSFTVELERDGYFYGAMGRVLKDIMGRDDFFQPGERVRSKAFDTVIVEASDQGVRKLLFRFRKPLTSDDYHFYLGSRFRHAYPLTWKPPSAFPSTQPRTAGSKRPE